MATLASPDRAKRSPGFFVWRILVWLLLLLSAFGSLQYFAHAQRTWRLLRASVLPNAAELSVLHGMLGWDVTYLLASFALIVICAGCALRQAWARPCMRVAAVVLAIWLLITGFLQWHDLQTLGANSAEILAQAQQLGTVDAAQIFARIQRGYELALLFKTVGFIALLWLASELGKPTVRVQFRSRR